MDKKKLLLWMIALFFGLQLNSCVWYGHDYDDYHGYHGYHDYYGYPYHHHGYYRYWR